MGLYMEVSLKIVVVLIKEECSIRVSSNAALL